jgi:hypothetical protein
MDGNYGILRQDRLERQGGGVCALLKRGINFVKVQRLCFSEFNCEVLSMDIIDDVNKVNFSLVYRPPTNGIINDKNLINKLTDEISKSKKNAVILGDLNYPNIDWKKHPKDKNDARFYNFVTSENFKQIIDQPTMFKSKNINDLILVNDENLLTNLNIDETEISDHKIIEFSIKIPKRNPNNYKKEIKLFKKADYKLINCHLAWIDWDKLLANKNPTEMVEMFNFVIEDAITKFVPKKTVGSKAPIKFPPHIRIMGKEKQLAWRKYKQNHISKDEYKKLSKEYKSAVSEHKLKLMSNKIKQENLNSIHKLVKRSKMYMEEIPVISTENGEIIDSKSKAELFGKKFARYFGNTDSNISHYDIISELSTDNIPEFEPYMIESVLKKLPAKTSQCPDPANLFFLKKCATPLAFPLSIIFKKSIETGNVPEIWKLSHIYPIYKKKGSRNEVENYRPVSLTSSVVRVFEKFIHIYLKKLLHENKIISNDQFGFMPHRSCMLQLISTVKDWIEEIEKGNSIDVIYFDLEKAFDSVDHEILIDKLNTIGINPLIGRWIKNFLTNRKSVVKIDDKYSEPFYPKTGVPQGSVLGPTLFVIYINDLTARIAPNTKLKLFADDFKLYRVVNNDTDQKDLQESIIRASDWSIENKMKFSVKKTIHLKIGKIKNNFTYELNGETISSSETVRDLGITVDSKLSFEPHINKIVKAANFRQYNLFRILPKKLNPELKILAYKTYVRPILEYATEVYNPYKISLKKRMEKPQRTFTKKVIKISNEKVDYADRLKICALDTLELRRSRTDLLTAFKIIHKLYDLPSSNFFTQTIRPSRKQPNSLFMPHLPKIKKAQNFFSYRILNKWNNLPKNVAKLDLHDIKDPDIFAKYLDKLPVTSIVPNPVFDYSRT